MALINGTSGAETITGTSADDTIFGLGGDDTLIGNGGRDSLDGGDGFDTADFRGTPGDLDVDLADSVERAVTNSTLVSIEAVHGTDGDDAIAGDAGSNRLDGSGGDDSLNGAGGDDTLIGYLGGNVLDGGADRDTADYEWAGTDDHVVVNLADGTAEVTGAAGTDPAAVDALSNIEDATGGAGDDTIIGDGAGNALAGASGADSLSGGAGDDTLSGGAGDDALVGGAGTDTAVLSGRRADFVLGSTKPFFMGDSVVLVDTRGGGEGTDTVSGVEFFAFSDGTVSVAELVGSQPRSPDTGPRPPATIVGTAGDDRLALGAGGDVTDGLGGRDWLDLTAEGSRGSTVTVLPGGAVEVAHGARVDTLLNVEEIRFLDGRIVFDPADPAAQVARLYEAALDRLPDQGGFNFWVDGLGAGYPLSLLADGFLDSLEFQARFGGTTTGDGAFVDRLYLNILDRAGEAEGRAFWIDSLGRGTDRAEVLAAFSESSENKAGTAAFIQTGIWDRNETAAEVARLYDTVLGRAPDAPGLAFWKGALESGVIDLAQAADEFTGSAEFQATYGNLGNRDFVNALYVNTLDRPAEAEGLNFWTGRLDAGVARSAVVLAFSESPEHVELTAPAIQSDRPGEFGIVFA